jgi:hypothetical protein
VSTNRFAVYQSLGDPFLMLSYCDRRFWFRISALGSWPWFRVESSLGHLQGKFVHYLMPFHPHLQATTKVEAAIEAQKAIYYQVEPTNLKRNIAANNSQSFDFGRPQLVESLGTANDRAQSKVLLMIESLSPPKISRSALLDVRSSCWTKTGTGGSPSRSSRR